MTALAAPDVRLHASWAAAVTEFGDSVVHGSGVWRLPEQRYTDLTLEGCARFVALLLEESDPQVPLPDDRVPCTYFWITDGAPDEVVGFLALRHRLNDWLFNEGGHIGYSVRPSRRRRGHASEALGLAIRRAALLGIERVLVTCDDDNLASARTIERNGGAYEDTRNGKRRYWIETGPPPTAEARRGPAGISRPRDGRT
jgi:predicted acetyltransferase